MGKPKNTTINNIANANIDIDYDKLAMAIVKAKKIIEEEEQEKYNKLQEERSIKVNSFNLKLQLQILMDKIKTFKIKEFPKDIWSILKSLLYILVFPKNFFDQCNMRGNLFLFSTTLLLIYHFLSWILLISFIAFMILPFFLQNSWYMFSLSLLCLIFRSATELAIQEIDNIRDMQELTTLFTSIITFIAMIAAIASFVATIIIGGVI